jgi:hypothetical protein
MPLASGVELEVWFTMALLLTLMVASSREMAVTCRMLAVPAAPRRRSLGGRCARSQVRSKPGREQPVLMPNGYGTLTLPHLVGQPGSPI